MTRRRSSIRTLSRLARPRSRDGDIRRAPLKTLAYGSVRFASKVGQLAGNHFLTIVEGLDQLRPLGELTLRHGAQEIVFERV